MVGCSKENFDSYFSKLQNICTDSMNEDVKSSSAAAAAANAMDPAKGHHIQQGDAPPPTESKFTGWSNWIFHQKFCIPYAV